MYSDAFSFLNAILCDYIFVFVTPQKIKIAQDVTGYPYL